MLIVCEHYMRQALLVNLKRLCSVIAAFQAVSSELQCKVLALIWT